MRVPQLNRSVVALLMVTLLLGTVLPGCRTSPRAQRETALLRAEILDLEDQFYSMKSRYEAANRELQICRGVPGDGTYLGSNEMQGTCIDGGCVDGGFVAEEYVDGPIIESGEYGPDDVFYDVPVQTGRYVPQATATLRDSARRIFGRGSLQNQSPSAQPNLTTPRRTSGLFTGRGLGLLRRNQAAEPATNLGSDVAYNVPAMNRQSGAMSATSGMTPRLTKESASQRDPGDSSRDPFGDIPINLDIPFADGSAAEYSPQDNVVFDDPNGSGGVSVNGPVTGYPVTQIDISSNSTHGEDVDGQPGHEGVVVLIQPKDRNGVLVKETGEVTVSLIDPSADGQGQRIGLWKFTPQELQLFEVKNEHSDQGYLLHLPWDGHVPNSRELLLYVRYWTSDGRRLETSTRLSIVPPANGYSPESPLIEGWTRRDPRWDKGTKSPAIPGQASQLANDPRIPDLKNAMGNPGDSGRGVKAIPASSSIKRPAWRPSR